MRSLPCLAAAARAVEASCAEVERYGSSDSLPRAPAALPRPDVSTVAVGLPRALAGEELGEGGFDVGEVVEKEVGALGFE